MKKIKPSTVIYLNYPEQILKSFGIDKTTKHHSYNYLYSSVIKAMKQYACPHNDIGEHDYDDKCECLNCGAIFIKEH